jgi:hypothetical protein
MTTSGPKTELDINLHILYIYGKPEGKTPPKKKLDVSGRITIK